MRDRVLFEGWGRGDTEGVVRLCKVPLYVLCYFVSNVTLRIHNLLKSTGINLTEARNRHILHEETD